MRKLFLLIPILFFSVAVSAAIPELTKSSPLTLTAASEGFSQSTNAKALVDGEWINWSSGTIQDGYAKWRVNAVNTGVFSVTVDMKSTNTYEYRVCVLDPATNDTITKCFTEHSDRHTGTSPDIVAYENTALPTLTKLNMFALAAGEYDIIVTNVVKWSEGQVRGITLSYEQGDITTVPAAATTTLIPDNALLSSRAWIDKSGAVDSILFTPRGSEGHNLEEWVKWAVEIPAAGYYNFTANTFRASSQKFEITLLNQDESVTLISNDNGGQSIGSGNKSISTGTINLAKGIYILRVRNIYQYAESRLLNAVVTYNGGKAVDVPGTLNIDDIILSDEAWVDKTGDVDSIFFTAHGSEGHNSVNYVKWKVNVATAGAYNFKANVYRKDGSQRYEIKVLSNDENTEFISNSLTGIPAGLSSINSGNVYLEQGVYTIQVRNTYDYAKGALLSVVAEYIGGIVQAMPGTATVADAWFSANGTRADGKISFPDASIQEGWVKWNVSFASAANYNVTVNVNSSNGHNFTVALYRSETDASPISVTEGGQTSAASPLVLGAMEVPAGNYILKVTNAIQYSDAQLISVNFAYAGGGVVNIPGTIDLSEAILSSRAFIDGDGLHFTDNDHLGHISEEYAKWNISVAADGIYKFTANCNTYGESYSNLKIQVLQGGVEKYAYTPQYTYTGEKAIASPEWFLEAGDYELQLSNPADYSNGYLVSLAATQNESVLIVDEMATNMQYITDLNGQSKKPLLKRSFKANMYNTVVFPFNGVTDEELTTIFGAGYKLLAMTSAELEGNTLNLNFAAVDLSGSTYGRPYLIMPTQDVVNPLFSSKTIYASTSHLTVTGTNANFIGSYVKGEVPAGEDNLFLGANNLLYFSETATPIKGMRAYFQVKGVPHPSQAIRHANIIANDQVVTSIDFTKGENNKVMKAIENGQLIIIRNGVRFTVQGQRIQ